MVRFVYKECGKGLIYRVLYSSRKKSGECPKCGSKWFKKSSKREWLKDRVPVWVWAGVIN